MLLESLAAQGGTIFCAMALHSHVLSPQALWENIEYVTDCKKSQKHSMGALSVI